MCRHNGALRGTLASAWLGTPPFCQFRRAGTPSVGPTPRYRVSFTREARAALVRAFERTAWYQAVRLVAVRAHEHLISGAVGGR